MKQKAMVLDWRCAASYSVEHKPQAAEQGNSWLGGASGAAASVSKSPGKTAAMAPLHEAPAGSQQPHLQEPRHSNALGRHVPVAERQQAQAGQQEQTSLFRASQGASRPGSLQDIDAAASSDTTQHAVSQAAKPEPQVLLAGSLQGPVDRLPGAQSSLPTSQLRVSCADRTAVPVGLRWQTASADRPACSHQLHLLRRILTTLLHPALPDSTNTAACRHCLLLLANFLRASMHHLSKGTLQDFSPEQRMLVPACWVSAEASWTSRVSLNSWACIHSINMQDGVLRLHIKL